MIFKLDFIRFACCGPGTGTGSSTGTQSGAPTLLSDAIAEHPEQFSAARFEGHTFSHKVDGKTPALRALGVPDYGFHKKGDVFCVHIDDMAADSRFVSVDEDCGEAAEDSAEVEEAPAEQATLEDAMNLIAGSDVEPGIAVAALNAVAIAHRTGDSIAKQLIEFGIVEDPAGEKVEDAPEKENGGDDEQSADESEADDSAEEKQPSPDDAVVTVNGEEAKEPSLTAEGLSDWTVAELKVELTERNIDIPSGSKKADLIALLLS